MRRAAVEAILCATFLVFSPGVSASASESGPAAAKNVKLVGHLDIEGGGMVDVHEGIAYIGHIKPPFATSILDVSDPANPKILSRIEAKPHTHSHKARACGGVMLSNRELYADSVPAYIFNSLFRRGLEIGLAVTDVSNPVNPREIALLPASGIGIANAPAGVHRFEFDCERELAYVSATLEGYRGNIVLIVDLSDPESPKEIGRWWAEGQWIAGGEKPTWSRNEHRVHHPNRLGDRLYVPMWHGGFAIVDISDTANPKTVAHVDQGGSWCSTKTSATSARIRRPRCGSTTSPMRRIQSWLHRFACQRVASTAGAMARRGSASGRTSRTSTSARTT
jgi:hypothetical protein